MTIHVTSDQPIGSLTVAELDALITRIVRRVLREETPTSDRSDSAETLPDDFLATFGAWEDDHSADEIIADIYASRTIANPEISL